MPPQPGRVTRLPQIVPQTATVAVPAPVGGWNARDSLDNMDPTDAISLINLFPGFGKVSRRNGWGIYANNLGGPVQTLAEYNAFNIRKLFAAAAGSIYDVSHPGDVTAVKAQVTGSIAPNTATISISTTTMTVTAIGTGTVLATSQTVTGTGVTANTFIVQQLTGTHGGTGTYQVFPSQTVTGPLAVTTSGGGLTVTTLASGTLKVGYLLTGPGVVADQVITALGTGTGGVGTYAVSQAQTLASTTLKQTVALASGFSSNKWQTGNFQNAAAIENMVFVNGHDLPQLYSGNTGVLAPATISGTRTDGSALNTALLVGVVPYQGRMFYWENSSQTLWYSAIGAVAGVLSPFNLGELSGFGGNIVNICTWSRDGGAGPDDYAVILMSSGDVLMYGGTGAGTDIGDANKWSLNGIFRIGSPIGARCSTKLGPDLAIINVNGFVPLSQVLPGLWNPSTSLSDKITGAASAATSQYHDNFGWQILLYPMGNQAIFNVPLAGNISDQYVLNTATGAWCRFTGMNAQCWSLYNDDPYFGDPNGNVCLYSGSSTVVLPDQTTVAGTIREDNHQPIYCSVQTAWNYFGDRSRLKRLCLLRPAFATDNVGLGVGFAVGADFRSALVPPFNFYNASGGTPWGSPWGSPWSPGTEIFTPRLVATGVGNCFSTSGAANMQNVDFDWYSLTYQYEPGTGV